MLKAGFCPRKSVRKFPMRYLGSAGVYLLGKLFVGGGDLLDKV